MKKKENQTGVCKPQVVSESCVTEALTGTEVWKIVLSERTGVVTGSGNLRQVNSTSFSGLHETGPRVLHFTLNARRRKRAAL